MRKFLAILFAALLLCGSCLAEGLDYASMTDDQLHAIVDAARNELAKRELIAAENTVLFEQDGVTIYMTGDWKIRESSINDSIYLEINVIAINNTNRNVGIRIENPSVNGWDVSASLPSGVSANKKAKDVLTLDVADAEVKTAADLQDLTMTFRLLDEDSYKTFSEGEPVTIHFNAQ